MEKKRCSWCNLSNPKYVYYHDHVWGVPVHDDRKLFEMLVLEGFQAGLSWECILNKQEAFEQAFDHFDVQTVAQYDEVRMDALAHNPGIVRNRNKIRAAVTNARVFLNIQKEYGSFDAWLWSFTDHNVIVETGVISSDLSDRISTQLKQMGMKYVGTVIIYAYLQAVGVINGHEEGCQWKGRV
ncbi:MAG: DNA-3-methyladenine glycosylase I [Bulleidia sp.]